MLLDDIILVIDLVPIIELSLESSTTNVEINTIQDPVIVDIDMMPNIPLFLVTDND